MTAADLELGMRLKTQVGWNQTLADWRRFLQLEPDGCFVAEWDGQPVATTTTCAFGSVAWIAMVLVDPEFRHRGIASRLVNHALGYLRRRSVATVRLDATGLGQRVYQRLGFVADYELIRFEGQARRDASPSISMRPGREVLDHLTRLDRAATGTARTRLIKCLVEEHPEAVRAEIRGGKPLGYGMFRPGANAVQVGPVVASQEQVGRELCDWACGQVAGQRIFVDLPMPNRAAVHWAMSRGLTEQRRFTRMHHGEPVEDDLDRLWASSGAEKG